MQNELLRPQKAADFLGMSLRGLYNLCERDPDFPRKIVLSKRCVGFRRESLELYLATKEAAAA